MIMARDNKGFACHKHSEHVSYEIHHVWPLGYHGPDVTWNKIRICPNAHSDIHYLMELMFRGKSFDWKEYGPQIRFYAKQGYQRVIAYADDLARLRNGGRS
jgi:hypothetical protein